MGIGFLEILTLGVAYGLAAGLLLLRGTFSRRF